MYTIPSIKVCANILVSEYLESMVPRSEKYAYFYKVPLLDCHFPYLKHPWTNSYESNELYT